MENGESAIDRSQRVLVEFLHADLSLAFTFLQLARMRAPKEPERARSLIEKAAQALAKTRQMSGRVQEGAEWQAVQTRVNELEKVLLETQNLLC